MKTYYDVVEMMPWLTDHDLFLGQSGAGDWQPNGDPPKFLTETYPQLSIWLRAKVVRRRWFWNRRRQTYLFCGRLLFDIVRTSRPQPGQLKPTAYYDWRTCGRLVGVEIDRNMPVDVINFLCEAFDGTPVRYCDTLAKEAG